MGKVSLVGLCLLLVLSALAGGEEEGPSVVDLVETVRWDSEGRASALALELLARRGPSGWRALGGLARDLEDRDVEAALRVALALASGAEEERRKATKSAYVRVRSEEVRGALALGLARGYPADADLLHRRIRENLPGAGELLLALAERGLPDEELKGALAVEALAPIAHGIFRKRGTSPGVDLLLPRAREEARQGLPREACLAFATRFAEAPEFDLLRALALLLEGDDDDLRAGAHCLLLTTSGMSLPPDRLQWDSWIEASRGRYEPRGEFSPGGLAAGVARGVRYLRKDLLADGRCVYPRSAGNSTVGGTALAVRALRAAGVPRDDPAIRKAVEETLLVFGRDGAPGLPSFPRAYETYTLALLAMALRSLDPVGYREPLVAIRDRLCEGILDNGQWTYQCLSRTEGKRPASGDNSNTQYAALGLRALSKSGVEVPASVWERAASNWWKTVRSGGWGYRTDGKERRFSMTAAGLGSLSICLEGLHARNAGEMILADEAVCGALEYLGKLLLTGGYEKQTLYALYGVERACRLTGADRFESENRRFDWYHRGAGRLLATQLPDGSWKSDHGPPIDTSFAILFLTKATVTIAGARGLGVVKVPLSDKEDVPEPKPAEKDQPAPTPAPPAGPHLELETTQLRTRTGEVVIRGVLGTEGATLTVMGFAVTPDEHGRFAVPFTVDGPREVPVVATGRDGRVTAKRVDVIIDADPPELALDGSKLRHVGKQRMTFRSREPLASIEAQGRHFPADGPVAEATVDLHDGLRSLAVVATDLAGNRARHTFDLEVANRALAVDGKSCVRVDPRDKPAVFTLECWVRGEKPPEKKALGIVANVEGSGYGIFWGAVLPKGIVRVKSGYIEPKARRPWKWSSWTHLALTYDGAAARLFVDGKPHGEVEGGPRVTSKRPLYVGAEPDGRGSPASHFTGQIDEVRLSDVVRYGGSFDPEKTFMADRHTLLLLHFDLDTGKAFLDASDRQTHGRPYGEPKVVEAKR